ncbi:MAG: hypothetical protein M3Y57_01855 [Acidobacteriota bacterium]|nr:hypothetical protein [Acidobacteriota bacterium]
MRRFETQAPGMRLVALLCLLVVLAVFIAAPVHNHDPRQEGNCLICHAAERGTVVHINTDAGKSYEPPSHAVIATVRLSPILEPPISTRSSRAPPTQFLSL